MFERHGRPASRRLLAWFVVTTIAPAAGLGWLGWRMVRQDRELERQRVQERREQAVELAATALQRTLAELEAQLTAATAAKTASSGAFPEGAAFLAFDQRGVLSRTGARLPYVPASRTLSPIPPLADDILTRADELEFQKQDNAGAIGLLSTLARAAEPDVRAEALLRMARSHRTLGNLPNALDVFGELLALDDVPAAGLPAGMLGHQGRAMIFADLKRGEDLEREAGVLYGALGSGRWTLTRSQYDFSTEQARGWLTSHAPPPHDPERLALAEAAEVAWNEWQTVRSTSIDASGRRTVWVRNHSVLVLAHGSGERLSVLLIGPECLDRTWRQGLRLAGNNRDVDFALSDAEGHAVLGPAGVPLFSQSVRTASVTQLPWTVHAVSIAPNAGAPGLSAPGRLMLAAVLVMTLVVLVGGYFINRAIARELAVARLQSDFVAAVSHEFRTPLTTIRQLSEMLVRGRVSTNDKREQFYETLLRESERLHRLVESLLNFARLESGQLKYRFEAMDADVFIREVVREFQDEVSALGYRIELSGEKELQSIRGDRELLARVFWNLLDNAVKYSPDHQTVSVEVANAGDRLLVRVHDEGLGIPVAEQREIFRKFVRGAAPKAATIKGTGIGLAMAREIVQAHGGEIQVESEIGHGSTFTVVLPIWRDDSMAEWQDVGPRRS